MYITTKYIYIRYNILNRKQNKTKSENCKLLLYYIYM